MTPPVHQQLLALLNKIDRPGTFCTSGILPATVPGVEVAGVGPIGLPLGKSQATALKKHARQAPYGKGTKTLVDTSVRRVWEIDAEEVVLANPEWPGVVEQAVREARTALGLEKQKLDAHLYKLLLYEPGSFFLSHRDGEKLDRMVATLVIALPTAHSGGELIVRHEGREEAVDFGPLSPFMTQFAAFYADCEHEIRPVTSGFRLALVYNLTLAKAKKPIAAPTSREHIAAAAAVLGRWARESPPASVADKDGGTTKLAVLLDHQYTQAGLTRDALKGVDRAKADVLFAAAREAGLDASLALVTYWETGSAEPSGDYGYGRRRRYGWYEDDEDSGDHEMGEVFDSSLTAEHFSDADGKPLAFGEIPLDESEIVSTQPLASGEPDKEDFEGYTGNAGMTLERWYHRAAVVLWPVHTRFDVLCEAGVEAAVGGLAPMVERWLKARKGEQEALRQPCLDFARRIIALWPERMYRQYPVGLRPGESADVPLLPLLDKLGDPDLIAGYIRDVLGRDATVDPGRELGSLCHQHDWRTFANELRHLFANTARETVGHHTRLLADFALRKDQSAARKAVCSDLARELMAFVERWDPTARSGQYWYSKPVDLAELLPPLVQSLLTLQETNLLDRLATYVLDRPKVFDLTTVQVPAMLKLQPWLTRHVKKPCLPLHRWLTAIRETLEERAAHPPREPNDWRRASSTGCGCKDCQALSQFLADPTQATLRLPLAERRRRHIHDVIDSHKLDTTHVTERRGSPYVLVCTKTKASYERALQAHHVDLDQLDKVRRLIEKLPA